jgi:hypothetical protein
MAIFLRDHQKESLFQASDIPRRPVIKPVGYNQDYPKGYQNIFIRNRLV